MTSPLLSATVKATVVDVQHERWEEATAEARSGAPRPRTRQDCRANSLTFATQRTARLLVLGFELADHSLGLVVEGGEDLVGVLFRVVKSQAPDREIDFTLPDVEIPRHMRAAHEWQ
jgi:hypothetical protein